MTLSVTLLLYDLIPPVTAVVSSVSFFFDYLHFNRESLCIEDELEAVETESLTGAKIHSVAPHFTFCILAVHAGLPAP